MKQAPIAQEEIILCRVFQAPRHLVWGAWTQASQIAQWFGPHGFSNPVCEWDAVPGGLIRIHMRDPNGNVYPMTGKFREVRENSRLVFVATPEDDDGNELMVSLTTVDFAAKDGGTEVTLRADAVALTEIATLMLQGMRAGWTQSLERLAALLN